MGLFAYPGLLLTTRASTWMHKTSASWSLDSTKDGRQNQELIIIDILAFIGGTVNTITHLGASKEPNKFMDH